MNPALPFAVLLLLGMGWGLNQTLSKVATSTGHGHFGLLLAQCVVGVVVLGVMLLARGRAVPLGRGPLSAWVLIGLVGTVLPAIAYYQAVARLPAGIMAMMLSLIPMIALPLAVLARIERPQTRRLVGLALGLVGVGLIALPGSGGPERGALVWVLVAVIPPALWAIEAVGVARWGTGGLDPVETLFGANVLGAALALPLAWTTGQVIDLRAGLGAPEWAIVAAGVINAFVYTGYIWLVGRAGATFAAQVSYLVTGFGVIWAVTLLGERYGLLAWLALVAMLAGLALVQPRPGRPGAAASTLKATARPAATGRGRPL